MILPYNRIARKFHAVKEVKKMKGKKRFFKMIMEFLIIILVVGFFAGDLIEMTFASDPEKEPDVKVTIDSEGELSQTGNLLELKDHPSYMWYPGREVNGVLRLYNNSNSRVEITSLGLEVDITRRSAGSSEDMIENEFLNHMHLTVTKGRLFNFDDETILRDKFSKMVNSFVELDDTNQFTVGRNDSIDLKYTVLMDKGAGNELQNLTANVKFLINVSERPINNRDDDDDDDDDNDNKKDPLVMVDMDTDLDKHWAHDCIITLLDHNVIQGYPHESMTIEDYRNGEVEAVIYVNEAVQPDMFITRAETAVLVGRALSLPEGDGLFSGYIDYIPPWAKGHIISTTKADVFKGYPFARFKSNNNITREEMITVLVRGFDIGLEDPDLELSFEDKEDISPWALESVKAGVENKLIAGYPDNTYRPQNSITRSEAFTIICKLLGYHEEHAIE